MKKSESCVNILNKMRPGEWYWQEEFGFPPMRETGLKPVPLQILVRAGCIREVSNQYCKIGEREEFNE